MTEARTSTIQGGRAIRVAMPSVDWDRLRAWRGGHGSDADAAQAAASLGLRALAEELGGAVEGEAGAPEPPMDELVERATRRALGARGEGVDLGAAVSAWAACGEACWRADDGNVVWRDGDGAWHGLADVRCAAQRAELPDDLRASHPKPIVIDGLSTPWLLERVWASSPPRADGYRPLIIALAHTEAEAARAMAMSEAEDLWSDSRVVIFAGADRLQAMESFLAGRLGSALPASVLRTPTVEGDAAGGASELVATLKRLTARQQDEHRALTVRLGAAFGATGSDRSAAFDGARPLRVLIPTTRYSTFVRHSAEDLAMALRSEGHEAQVLMEEADDARLVTVGYMRAVEAFQPDAAVLINYARCHLGDAVPARLPVVTWVQDHMPHLFAPGVAESLGPLDFLVGHMHESLFNDRTIDPDRARFLFVPASETAFHDGACEPGLGRELACDIAYVSHQSEPPDALHDRLRPAFAGAPLALDMIDAIRPLLVRAGEASGEALRLRGCAAIIGHWEEAGLDADPRLCQTVQANYVAPMLERCFRHATLRWAAACADELGLSFRIHGSGWESHPTLARFAAPALDHGEALRTLYGSARVNLHISAASNAHQRVGECALSGGLMLRRGPCPDVELLRREALRRMATCFAPAQEGAATDMGAAVRYRVRHPLAPDPARFWPLFDTPDYDGAHEAGAFDIEDRRGRYQKAARVPSVPLGAIPDYAFPNGSDTLFMDRASLRAMIMRAVSDGSWRQRTIAGHREAARRSMTYASAAREIVDMLRVNLAGAGRAAA